MKYGRRDLNESDLVVLARQLGAQWLEMGPLDGWLLWRGLWLPVEVKAPEREGQAHEFTAGQKRFFTFARDNGGRWLVWRTRQDVIKSLGGRVAA